MHNERPMVPDYERLTFCLIGVAWPNELIKDRRTTPYNVGSTLELRDFDLARDDMTPLVDALRANPEQGRRLIERVLHWTGGHPFLTTRLCASLQEIGAQVSEDVDRLVDDGFRSLERMSGDVLSHFQQVPRFLETRAADGLATFGLYGKILKGARERDQPTFAHTELKLSGLVKRDSDGYLVLRNRIYARLFDRHWFDSVKPKRNWFFLAPTLANIVFGLILSFFGVYSQEKVLLSFGIWMTSGYTLLLIRYRWFDTLSDMIYDIIARIPFFPTGFIGGFISGVSMPIMSLLLVTPLPLFVFFYFDTILEMMP
jgi:hypothetical protein